LFATGEHQIVEAINLLGVTESSTELVLVGLSENKIESNALIDKATAVVGGIPDDSILNVDTPRKREDLKKTYNISDREMTASKMTGETDGSLLKRLVIERSALLVLES
jgi:tRNA threonylcarbamoyladenosine modification (KEOPS) complex Cgi121 subunit